MATMGADSIFVDANVLIYADLTSSPFHTAARGRLTALHSANQVLWISRQVIREYLVALTRGQTFASPVAPSDAARSARVLASQLVVAAEGAEVGEHLLTLIERFDVKGKQVHDANIVATMIAYGVKRLLTHNTDDFARFGNLIEIVPLLS